MKNILFFGSLLMLLGCTATPQGLTPVEPFYVERYLGVWYEIARLDHPFERGLSQITATYSLRSDGGIDVLNRGYNQTTNQWKQAKGKAYFLNSPRQGCLKVSFFWPFYAGYHVIELDQQGYTYALVSGPNRDYLWILSRTKNLDEAIQQKLIDQAKALGFATENLIFVEHCNNSPRRVGDRHGTGICRPDSDS